MYENTHRRQCETDTVGLIIVGNYVFRSDNTFAPPVELKIKSCRYRDKAFFLSMKIIIIQIIKLSYTYALFELHDYCSRENSVKSRNTHTRASVRNYYRALPKPMKS